MSAVPEKISDEKLKELIAKTVSNGTFAELRTTRFDFQTPQQSLKSAQDRYAEHASGKAPLSPSESIALRGRISFLSNIVNPGQSNMWGDYSAAEKNYIAEKAAQQRSASNNLGMMFGGPVFAALPAIGRLFNAPEDVVENLGVINADLAGVALGGGRVSPKPLARPATSNARGSPLEPRSTPQEVRIEKPVLETAGGLYVVRSIPKIQRLDGIKAKLVEKKLPPKMEDTFMGREYKAYELQEDVVLPRAGEEGKGLGQYFSRDAPVSEIQTRIDKAVLPKWPNGDTSTIDFVHHVKIPSGTVVYVGEIANQGGFYLGGTQQIVVVQPWNVPGVKVISSTPLGK
jgi:hypothetical protein